MLAQYHDQGLIPVKLAVVRPRRQRDLGLPFVRTSVDHGTGFDIVERGIADEGSLLAAIRLAADLVAARRALAASAGRGRPGGSRARCPCA